MLPNIMWKADDSRNNLRILVRNLNEAACLWGSKLGDGVRGLLFLLQNFSTI